MKNKQKQKTQSYLWAFPTREVLFFFFLIFFLDFLFSSSHSGHERRKIKSSRTIIVNVSRRCVRWQLHQGQIFVWSTGIPNWEVRLNKEIIKNFFPELSLSLSSLHYYNFRIIIFFILFFFCYHYIFIISIRIAWIVISDHFIYEYV